MARPQNTLKMARPKTPCVWFHPQHRLELWPRLGLPRALQAMVRSSSSSWKQKEYIFFLTKVFILSQFFIFPRYTFSVLEGSGWNFRHAYYHELHRRTLFKVGVLVFLYFLHFCNSYFSTGKNLFKIWKKCRVHYFLHDTLSCWPQNKMQITAVSTLTYNWAQVHFQRDVSAIHVQQAISKFMQELHLKTGKGNWKKMKYCPLDKSCSCGNTKCCQMLLPQPINCEQLVSQTNLLWDTFEKWDMKIKISTINNKYVCCGNADCEQMVPAH